MNVGEEESLGSGVRWEKNTLFLTGLELGAYPFLCGRPELEKVLKELVSHNVYLPERFSPKDQLHIKCMFQRTF